MGYREGTWTPTKRRGPIVAEFSGPGPASVALPSLLGNAKHDPSKSKAPAFTFRSRYNEKLKLPGPGAGKYLIAGVTRKGRESLVAITISGRYKKEKLFNTPAPNAYHVEKSDSVVLGKSPSYSLGVKIRDPMLLNVPAPNRYTVSTSLFGNKVKAPSYTLTGKRMDPKPIMTPAPNKYVLPDSTTYKRKSPCYSLGNRTKLPYDKVIKPGPGAHFPEMVSVAKCQAPRISFGIRHSPYTVQLMC